MFRQTALAAVVAVAFLSSFGGAYAAATGGESGDILPSNELSYWKGSREELRANCAGLLGVLVEKHGKTLCYSDYRQALYICKNNGMCQTQPWYSQTDSGPWDHGGYSQGLTESGEGGGVMSEGDDDGGSGGPIIIL